MPERVYMNRIPGEQRIHVEIGAAEIPALLEDLYEFSLGRNRATEKLVQLLEQALVVFQADAGDCGHGAEYHGPEAGCVECRCTSTTGHG